MTRSKVRRQIAFQAAQLMYARQESEYYRAKMKAARRVCRGWVKPSDLPSNAEIRDQVQVLARTHEGELRDADLREMRIEALRMMRILQLFRPRLIGSVWTGHVRRGSDIDLHVFADSVAAVQAALDREAIVHDVQRKQVRKHGDEYVFFHVHINDRFPFELTVYPSSKAHYGFTSSVTGKAIERASTAELEQFLRSHYPDQDLDQAMVEIEDRIDPFQLYEALLLPLENVQQSPKYHPEGDALYHSLQVFDQARDLLPYDEEFLLAALLHDVGKAIDSRDHVEAALDALRGFVTDRTYWLISRHSDAHALRDRTLGMRARRRLARHDSYEELLLLEQCDRAGRQQGVEVPDVDDALHYVRDVGRMCQW